MPGLRVASASGNWSNSATWTAGYLPVAGDTVCANGFTVTIDQDINVGILTTAAQTYNGATVSMTSNTTPVGYVVASSTEQTTQPAWYAFDGNVGSYWRTNTGTLPAWITYEFSSSIAINKYTLVFYGAGHVCNPKNWTFEGWNGSSWDILDTQTGQSSVSVFNSSVLPNTTAYKKYRFNITATTDNSSGVIINEIYLREYTYDASSGAAGGGFLITGSRTITCTNVTGILSGTTTALTVTAPNPSIVNLNTNINTSTISAVSTVALTGSCTTNIVGNLLGLSASPTNTRCVTINNGSVLNIVGNILTQGTQKTTLAVSNNSTVNVTGDIEVSGNNDLNSAICISATNATINTTGNITRNLKGGSVQSYAIELSTGTTLNVTGNVTNDTQSNATANTPTIYTTAAAYIKCVGTLTAGRAGYALFSNSTTAINLLSGPFVCSPYGVYPYLVSRMHLIPTLNNYIEFRDNSTNGALSPGAIASASRMVSADTISDSPLASNVRFGVSYGNGAYTGTCRIPSAANVSLNVTFDTGSIGTAYLSATDIAQMGTNIWNIPTANLTGSNTIGQRMANASTVDTMGNQLASLL